MAHLAVTTSNQAASFPGPADYKDATDIVKNKAPAFAMGTAKRDVFNAAALGQPGPGAYEIKSTVTVREERFVGGTQEDDEQKIGGPEGGEDSRSAIL